MQGARQRKFKLPAAKRPQQQQKSQGRQLDAHHRSQDQQGSLRTSMSFYHAKEQQTGSLLQGGLPGC
jgi:hypothetical protein